MKIPLQMKFENLDNQWIAKDGNAVNKDDGVNLGNAATMRDVLIVAISTETKEDREDLVNIVKHQMTRFATLKKLLATDETTESINLTPAEIEWIKPRVARGFNIMICGPAIETLDGNKEEVA